MKALLAAFLIGIATLTFTPAFANDARTCSNANIDVDVALAACNRITKLATDKINTRNIYHWRGLHLTRKGDLDAALKDFDRAIAAGQSWFQSYDWRGSVWARKGDPKKAVEDYSAAIKIAPKAELYDKRAAQLLILREYERALADLDEAIRLEPNNGPYHLNRADSLKGLKQYDRALADTSTAIRLMPKSYTPYHYRGYIWKEQAEYQRAIEEFSTAIKYSDQVSDLYYQRAGSYFAMHEYRKAIDDYGSAIKLDPKNTAPVYERLSAFNVLEEYDVVVQGTKLLLEKDPKDAKALNTRALAYIGMKQFDHAIVDLEAALSLDPKNGMYQVNKSSILREMGRIDEAIALLSSVVFESPNAPNAYLNRGVAWRVKGDMDSASKDFDEAIRLNPTYIDAFANRGLVLEAQGNAAKAAEAYRSALSQKQGGVFLKRYQRMAQARLDVIDASSGRTELADPQKRNRRIALVIGNSAYKHAGHLANPSNDATKISQALRDIGFEVTDGVNLDQSTMRKIFGEFLADAPSANVAVVFYAGHGMQVNGKNYLVPIDFEINNDKDASTSMVDVDFILSGLDDQIRTNIIILDACRNNPMLSEQKGAGGRGFSRVSGLAAPSGLGAGAALGAGTLLAFATAPGQVASDGEGTNSPFSTALGRHISTPGLEVQQMLTRVRSDVVAATKSKQVPWSNSSLLGEVFLVKAN
ncbi:tetratricopeptide repeat protein [Bradyrhizobium sp. LjRoot220]|uniref:tetratricopeptide repeat protein n=1 Tax=Bradyrhizobium sp. LjRoot220 TaxID=3342284 RepID=UPI003ECC9663